MAREKTHGREWVLARALKTKRKLRSWIPAFAGMTKVERARRARRLRRRRREMKLDSGLRRNDELKNE
jgi:hypothetical protein